MVAIENKFLKSLVVITIWIHLLVGLRHFLVGYQLKQLRTSVSSSWEKKGGQTLPHMFYSATVLLFRVIDVSVEIISEFSGPHHQPTDCTLLWRNANYSSSTSLFFSSCSFTAGCVIVHLPGELTDGTFTLPLRVCNSLLCWVEGGISVQCIALDPQQLSTCSHMYTILPF